MITTFDNGQESFLSVTYQTPDPYTLTLNVDLGTSGTLSDLYGDALCSTEDGDRSCGAGNSTSIFETSDIDTDPTLLSGSVSPTPEPGSLVLFGTGLMVSAGFARRRSRHWFERGGASSKMPLPLPVPSS